MAELDSYLALAEEAMDKANLLYSSLSWRPIDQKGTFACSSMPTDTSLHALKVEYFFKGYPLSVARSYFDTYIELNMSEVDLFDYYKLVKRYGPNAFTAHMRIKGNSVFAAREVPLFVCYLQLSESAAAIVARSADLPGEIYAEDAVIGEIDYSLYLFEPVVGDITRTHFVNITRYNPKGAMPSTLVNSQLLSRAMHLKLFVDSAANPA